MSQPAERIWFIYHYDRDPTTGELIPRPDEVQREFLELAVLASKIGGVFTLATRRKEIEEGLFKGQVLTLATVVRYRTFVPLEKAQEAPPAEQNGDHPPTPPPPGAEEVLEIDGAIEVPGEADPEPPVASHESVAAEMPAG